MTVALLAIVGFIGIYYIVSQVVIPSVSQSPTASEQPTIIQKPSENLQLEILNIAYSATETSAVIKWQTDKPTTSQVIIRDPAGTLTQTDKGTTMATDHRVTLGNLKAGTTYHYTVLSKDAKGNEVRKEGDLTTSKQGDVAPPIISDIKPMSITDSSATITWTTNEPATSQVKYGRTSSYGSNTQLDGTYTNYHRVTIAGLASDTLYHFAVRSTDASGNEVVSQADNQFRTKAPISIGPYEGNRAPDFTLQDIYGKQVSLSSFHGKKVIVNFWATWCGPCVSEMPHFQELYDPDQLVVLAIHVNQSAETAKSYVERQKFTFPVLLDTTGTTASAYSISAIPRTFFIDINGIIKRSPPAGGLNKAAIEEILKSL